MCKKYVIVFAVIVLGFGGLSNASAATFGSLLQNMPKQLPLAGKPVQKDGADSIYTLPTYEATFATGNFPPIRIEAVGANPNNLVYAAFIMGAAVKVRRGEEMQESAPGAVEALMQFCVNAVPGWKADSTESGIMAMIAAARASKTKRVQSQFDQTTLEVRVRERSEDSTVFMTYQILFAFKPISELVKR